MEFCFPFWFWHHERAKMKRKNQNQNESWYGKWWQKQYETQNQNCKCMVTQSVLKMQMPKMQTEMKSTDKNGNENENKSGWATSDSVLAAFDPCGNLIFPPFLFNGLHVLIQIRKVSLQKKNWPLQSLFAFVDLYLWQLYQKKGARFKFRLSLASLLHVCMINYYNRAQK